jgi:hypothetical protein
MDADLDEDKQDELMHVGPAGSPYKTTASGDTQTIRNIQHGHLYMLMHDFKRTASQAGGLEMDAEVSAVLIGIEGSAPMKGNFFGQKHSIDATSNELSAFGKRKWRDYRATGQAVPAEKGGIQVCVDWEKLRNCEYVIEQMKFGLPTDDCNEDEMQFFQQLLQGSDAEVSELLVNRFGCVRETFSNEGTLGGLERQNSRWRDPIGKIKSLEQIGHVFSFTSQSSEKTSTSDKSRKSLNSRLSKACAVRSGSSDPEALGQTSHELESARHSVGRVGSTEDYSVARSSCGPSNAAIDSL